MATAVDDYSSTKNDTASVGIPVAVNSGHCRSSCTMIEETAGPLSNSTDKHTMLARATVMSTSSRVSKPQALNPKPRSYCLKAS